MGSDSCTHNTCVQDCLTAASTSSPSCFSLCTWIDLYCELQKRVNCEKENAAEREDVGLNFRCTNFPFYLCCCCRGEGCGLPLTWCQCLPNAKTFLSTLGVSINLVLITTMLYYVLLLLYVMLLCCVMLCYSYGVNCAPSPLVC